MQQPRYVGINDFDSQADRTHRGRDASAHESGTDTPAGRITLLNVRVITSYEHVTNLANI
jgi:hypothetical protein